MPTSPRTPAKDAPGESAAGPAAPAPARRRLERDARRQQLIDAAVVVFARRGYAAVDVADIVAEAQVTRGTFYLYFQAKRDVFLAAIDLYLDLIQRQRRVALPGRAQGLHAQLAESFAASLRFQAEHHDLALVALRDGWGGDPEVTARLQEAGAAAKASLAATYARLIAAGRMRDCDARVAAAAIGGMLREVLLHEILLGGRTDEIDTIAASLADLVANGLLTRR